MRKAVLALHHSDDGADIELRWYEKKGSKPGSVVVYAHGGGIILSDVDKCDSVVSAYVAATRGAVSVRELPTRS